MSISGNPATQNINFMLNVASTTFTAAGTIIANLGLLKVINTISSIALACISYIQGMGVKSNEQKEGIPDDKRVGDKLIERGYKIILNDFKDLPKILAVISIGIGALYIGLWTGGTSLESLIAPFKS